MRTTKGGFTALISVVIISLTLLFAVVALAQRGIAGRLVLLDFERKAQSRGYAESCVAIARVAIANDPDYEESDRTLTVGKGECTLVSVEADTPSPGQSRIRATGVASSATTNFEVVVNSATAAINSWEELESL